LGLALALSLGLIGPAWAQPAQQDRVEILGDYRYTFHDPVSPAEAKNIAYTEAVRMAVDRSRPFLDATANVTDQTLLNQMRQIIVSGYLKDVQVVEQAEKDRTVYAKVRATIVPQEIKTVIEREINRGQGKDATGLDQNRALKILSVREEEDGNVAVVFKALQRLDWLNTAYDGSLRENADVMIDFYDEQGVPIGSDRSSARKGAAGDVLNPGQIGVQKFAKPPKTRSYRVWLVK
jgi:hypothetical protein